MQKIYLYLLMTLFFAVSTTTAKETKTCPGEDTDPVMTGAEQTDRIKDLVKNKRIGLIMNQTSILPGGVHLLDALLDKGWKIKKVFAPEHGFRGTDDAGADINNSVDSKTGIPVVSVYGKNNKPTAEQLADIDVIIFDIQDVGTRFYTYISTLHYAMESCAENDKEFIVLDRPNPNDYVDGPVRKKGFSSFVGVDPVPVLHGLTVGELAQMINGEGWIATGKNSCRLHVVSMKNWRHGQPYSLPVKPSPNLPNDMSVKLYPSLCFFEGTNISVGRGTPFPFQALGNPDKKYGSFTFTPQPVEGMDMNPLYKGKLCFGEDLRNEPFEGGLSLRFVIRFFEKSGHNEKEFFSRADWFDLLAGSDSLRKQIVKGCSEKEIRESWKTDLDAYRKIRKKYLLYDDYDK
ncbi:MAG: DUF1343 domain-containing protein [Tannerella sp.]|jgi:uncharacterized protein YbbC (DUF1343 family)|nr:DUF1343 domain-containing protein [Tannerella sp.]